jgi:hypothetical protein
LLYQQGIKLRVGQGSILSCRPSET